MTAQTLSLSITPRRLTKAGLVLLALAALWVGRQPLLDLLSIVKDREAIVAYLHGYGAWGPALLAAILAVQVVVATVPGHVFMIAGGYIYGFPTAFLITLAVTVAMSQFNFALARRFGRPLVCRLAPARIWERWENVARRQGFTFFFFAFILPIFPSDAMSYLGGLSNISPRRFFAAAFCGRLPCAALMTAIGAYGFQFTPPVWAGILIVSASMFLVWRLCVARIERRMLKAEA